MYSMSTLMSERILWCAGGTRGAAQNKQLPSPALISAADKVIQVDWPLAVFVIRLRFELH
jgi:hypothetical protein